MSGGYFNHDQCRIRDIADELNELIDNSGNQEVDRHGYLIHPEFTPEMIEKFKETIHWLKRSSEMVQRIDWYLSGDDDDKAFFERWDKEVRKSNLWLSIETAPINEWALFADSKKTIGDKPPFVHIDKINKRREATVNYTHNYTHWMPIYRKCHERN